MAERTRVVLLGTGTPIVTPERAGSGVAIVVDEEAYLVDCGAGVVARAVEAARSGIDALHPAALQTVFFTHLHSDHTVGYPDLILTPWVLGRCAPLEAYGPPGLAAMTERLLSAYEADIHQRLHGLERGDPEGWKVNVHEIEPGVIFESETVTVRAFPVSHGDWPAFGFRFETPDRTIVLSGDTSPTPGMVEHARGCDILIHEVYAQAGYDGRPEHWKRYHAAYHTSSIQLADLANQVRPELLVLYHQLYWDATDEDLLAEIRARYDGRVVSGRDLDRF